MREGCGGGAQGAGCGGGVSLRAAPPPPVPPIRCSICSRCTSRAAPAIRAIRATPTSPATHPRSSPLAVLALLALLAAPFPVAAAAPADPYALWAHGRAGEALPALHESALATQRWDAWLDLGLAAAAAGERGRAAVWLVEAARRAPGRSEPRTALRALGAELPASWSERLGPLALPGRGWWGLALIAVAGLALGYATLGRRRLGGAALIGAGCALLALPGQVAAWRDAGERLVAIAADTQLLDAAGAPQRALAAGSVLARVDRPPLAGRWLVALPDGRLGYVPVVDTEATP